MVRVVEYNFGTPRKSTQNGHCVQLRTQGVIEVSGS